MTGKSKILVAGATGYVGSHLVSVLQAEGYPVRALVRNPAKLHALGLAPEETFTGEVTRPETLRGCGRDIGVVISAVGITRQRDGLTYRDVDYQANLHLLEEALRSGVQKFIYVYIFHAEKMRDLRLVEAKSAFAEALARSGMDYCLVSPTGFFSDMGEFLGMARKGRVYVIGSGTCRINPIGGGDLAGVCIRAIDSEAREIPVGGPRVYTHLEIARAAFEACGKPPRITRIPLGVTRFFLRALRLFTSVRTYGPIEFLLAVLTMDMEAPPVGTETLEAYFRDQVSAETR